MEFPIPESARSATRIRIIGCGPSLDFADIRQLHFRRRTDEITITINAAYALFSQLADYQVVSDTAAIQQYAVAKYPGTALWASRKRNRALLDSQRDVHGCFIIDDVMIRRYGSSGSEAFCVAYELSKRLPIRSIEVIGLDFVELALPDGGDRYRYAACLRPHLIAEEPYSQLQRCVPPGFYDGPYEIHRTDNRSYHNQMREIARIVSADRTFRNLLQSKSFCDHAKLRPGCYDFALGEALNRNAALSVPA